MLDSKAMGGRMLMKSAAPPRASVQAVDSYAEEKAEATLDREAPTESAASSFTSFAPSSKV